MKRIVTCLLLARLVAVDTAAQSYSMDELLQLELENLQNVRVNTAGALTKAPLTKTPASVTRITREMIENSGARSLDELLEIFVPSLEIRRHETVGPSIGMRGNISGTDHKLLMQVNGRNVNDKTAVGALHGRFMSMLGDIDYIDVVRGPGSAIHGPGAIIGVISIHTLDSTSFEGAELSVRGGFIEYFGNLEIRWGKDLGDWGGLFGYYGVDKYYGANDSDAPAKFGRSFDPQGIVAGERIAGIDNHHESFRERPHHKFHLQYDKELENSEFSTWIRYVSGGEHYLTSRQFMARFPDGSLSRATFGQAYQQWIWQAFYSHDFTDNLRGEVTASFDVFDYEQIRPLPPFFQERGDRASHNYREDEYYARVLFQWDPAESHSLAFGGEISRDHLGLDGIGWPHQPVFAPTIGDTEDWYSTAYGLFGEYQWLVMPELTLFAGGRVDKHSYTKHVVSPKAAVIVTPGPDDTVKLVYNSSIRRGTEPELRLAHLSGDDDPDTERVDMTELSYRHAFDEHTAVTLSGYYSDIEVVSFNGTTLTDTLLGSGQVFGGEIEFDYRTEDWTLSLSYTRAELSDFDLEPGVAFAALTVEPNGFGSDLAGSAKNNLKIYARHHFTPELSADTSLRLLWGFDGLRNFEEFLTSTGDGPIEDSTAFEPSAFLNLGITYRYTDKLRIRADALNVLGWFDEDLNKRNHINLSDFRDEAHAFALQLNWKF